MCAKATGEEFNKLMNLASASSATSPAVATTEEGHQQTSSAAAVAAACLTRALRAATRLKYMSKAMEELDAIVNKQEQEQEDGIRRK